jgi:predicted AlkP superfamily phosphohydrolase/phosphomutase
MAPPTKVLFLGMDAGNKFLIQEWANACILPTFRSLFARGLVGDTISLDGFYEGSTWPSLYTGVTPARHAMHSLIQLTPGTYELHRISPGDFIKRNPFWTHLSQKGLRVAVLDIPLSGISHGLNGIQMVEWGCHDGVYGFSTLPPQLKQEVLVRFGNHPLTTSCDLSCQSPQEIPVFRDLLLEGVKRKTELTRHYLNQGGWDFFAQVFSESHCVGHQCWHLHDQGHPRHDPKTAALVGDPVRDVYVAIDSALGEILSQVDHETVVVILMGHCMAHYVGIPFLLPEILCRLNVAERPSADTSSATINQFDRVLTWSWRQVPEAIRGRLESLAYTIRTWIDRRQGRSSPLFFGIDPRKSRCFLLHNGASVCGLRVNLRGREPEGLVQPGSEMNAFCDELTQDLLNIVNLDTGRPAIKSVKRTAAFYRGEYLDYLPDLLVEWDDEKSSNHAFAGNAEGTRTRLASEKIGIVEGVNSYCRTGDHRPEGLFIAFGPGIKPGRLERPVSIMDFAPTFTSLFGVALPDVDGKPIQEILEAHLGLSVRRYQT